MERKQVKRYAFWYKDSDTIYMQTGFDSFEEAKSGLEEIAGIFCKRDVGAKGRIDKIEYGKITLKREYGISKDNERFFPKGKL